MRYMTWTVVFEPNEKSAPLEVYEIIRANNGYVEGITHLDGNRIICQMSDDVDLSIIPAKWQATELTIEEAMAEFVKLDDKAFFLPDGNVVFPTLIAESESKSLPIDYI